VLRRSVVHRFLLLLGTADSEWDFVVWHGLSSERMGCFSKLPKCTWQSIAFWASCAFSWKCFGLYLLYGLLFERGIPGSRSSAAPMLGSRDSRRYLLPSFCFLFGMLEGSACSSLLWHALPFGTCLIHPVSFCRSRIVCVKERTGQKREKEETLQTDEGQLHMESGSWKRT